MRGVTKRSEGYGDVGLAERPEPKPRAGTVVLRTAGAGICGTDLHIFKNEYKVAPPVVMGHEVCGFVEDVGEGVDPALLGRRFVCETFFRLAVIARIAVPDGRTSAPSASRLVRTSTARWRRGSRSPSSICTRRLKP